MLSVRALSCGYGHLQIVYDIDLEVAAGEWVALLGPAGAGKTTLLRSIAGLLPPLSGSVAFRGEDDMEIPIDLLFSGNPATTPVANFLPGFQQNVRLISYGAFAELDLRGRQRSIA